MLHHFPHVHAVSQSHQIGFIIFYDTSPLVMGFFLQIPFFLFKYYTIPHPKTQPNHYRFQQYPQPIYNLIMNSNLIFRTTHRLLKGRHSFPVTQSQLLSKHSYRVTPLTHAYFSTQKKPNDPDNEEKDWKEKFQQKVKNFNQKCDEIYQRRWPIRSLAIFGFGFLFLCLLLSEKKDTELSIIEFTNMLQTNTFKKISFIEEQYFFSKDLRAKRVEGRINDQVYYCYVNSFERIMEKVFQNPEVSFVNQRRSGIDYILQKGYLLFDTVSLVVILGILVASRKKGPSNSGGDGARGGMNPMQSMNKKFQMTKNVKVKFRDVAGLHQVKREVQEVVDFLKYPQKYTSLGATIPRGVLLTGPPGTGKTLLAKACAGEAKVPFFSVSGSDFVEMYVGVGASRVRDLFKQAKQTGGAAIIFIDELDAIGKKRGQKLGGNDERQSTLNQLLVEMDGFESNNKIVVMGATNRKQILDSALVRPGRFDREVEVGLPDLKGRFQIFKVHLKPLKLSSKYTMDEYAKRLASLTPGFSGAEIANLCNEAAILSARHEKQVVEMIDFEISSERVIGGVQRKGFVSLKEKKTVAYHQCGHAVVSWFLEGADPLLKVTIIPRSKGALGFAQYFINENQLQTKEELIDRICFILGGRCCQLFFFNEVTTGAYDDLSKAYNIAYALIAKYGMSDDIGNISYPDSEYTKAYSEEVEAAIDMQIQKIIKQCTQKTMKMVEQHQQHIKNLAEQLLIKETLDVRSIQKILGKRPFPPNKTFQAYLDTSETN